jgi:Effector Associated Constant Component 1
MEMLLRIRSDELDDVQLQSSVLELRRLIESETEVEAAPAKATAAPGTKGDAVTLGTLVLTFLSSGAAVSIFKVLETWLSRKRTIDLEATQPDGRKLVIKAEDLGPAQMAATQKMFEDFMK